MPPLPPDIAPVFAAFGPLEQAALRLRGLIFATASEDPMIGPLDEALKWGQPAYLTPSGSGSPLRIGVSKGQLALYAHCATTLISDFATLEPQAFTYEGRRAAVMPGYPADEAPLRMLIRRGLRYHLDKT